ncbi:hypothetical protein L1887_43792 [Cichorium endivia]|nr:hypothetical protein L1887_43792 [Cichorium endivia]
MALSIPSANTNIWNLQQDTVGSRLTNSRHGLADNGGAWVSYFGGNFDGDNGVISYDQDVSGIMWVWIPRLTVIMRSGSSGGAAGFAKGDISDRTGQLGYDWKPNLSGYVTPYAAVSGLFQSGDDYRLSNDMRMDGQSYDSLRYELGVDTGLHLQLRRRTGPDALLQTGLRL